MRKSKATLFQWMTISNLFRCLRRLKYLLYVLPFLLLLSSYLLFTSNSSSNKFPVRHSSSSNLTHDFFLYPQSRSSVEYDRIRIDDHRLESIFNLPQSNINRNLDSTSVLSYSETLFRSALFPIIWLDQQGDVHWNIPAQTELLNYILHKQYLRKDLSACLNEQLFLLEQWPMGFFSRYHCFIEHFGQTLYSPSMTLLLPKRFYVSQSGSDDFLQEGILRYYQSFSLCASYLYHPDLKELLQRINSFSITSSDVKMIKRSEQLLERDETTTKFKYSREIWQFGYDHVPHRRWLFDRNRRELKKILTYHSPISLFINHSNEHIYHSNEMNLTNWQSRNYPQGYPKDVLPGKLFFVRTLISPLTNL